MPEFKLDAYIMHHVRDSHTWQLPFLPPIALPSFLSLHGLMLIICAGILLVLFLGLYRQKDRVPKGLTNLLEVFVVFIRDEIARPFLGEKDGDRFTPLLCTFFFFILGLNVMGMVPLFSTATANFSVTLALALIVFFLMTVGTILRGGLKGFFKALMPPGAGWLLPMEIISLTIKGAALAIRLFANMLAGHMTILALLGLVVLFGWWGAPALPLAIAIAMLELFIAFLQAYIFVLLSAVFIGQMYHPEH